MASLWAELNRRNVVRVAVLYVVISWVILQVADVILPNLGAPEWAFGLILSLVVLFFIPALIFAWAYEITPQGLKRESDVDRSASITRETGRRLNILTIAAVLAGVGILLVDRFLLEVPSDPPQGSGSDVATPYANSVAVLAFDDLSPEGDQAWFAEGLSEEIISSLDRLPELKVAARTSAFYFKDRDIPIPEIAEALRVEHVVEGSVRRAGNQLRVSVQLIKASDGFRVWSETYSRNAEEVFAVQEDIAEHIASELGVYLDEAGRAWVFKTGTRNIQAYDLYLRGVDALRWRDRSRAIEFLQRASELDPEFAPTWASLAIALQVPGGDDEAEAAARRALSLDAENIAALTALASVFRTRGQWIQAGELFQRAYALDSGSSELIEDYAEFLGMVGKAPEMLAMTRAGMKIDPYMRPLVEAHVSALVMNGLYDEALAVVERNSEAQIHMIVAMIWGVEVHLIRNQSAEALGAIANARELTSSLFDESTSISGTAREMDAGLEALALAIKSPRDEAVRDRVRAQLVRHDLTSVDPSVSMAGVLLDLEEETIGAHLRLKDLVGAVPEEDLWHPIFADLRSSESFAEFVQALGLPEYWDAVGWPEQCRRSGHNLECR